MYNNDAKQIGQFIKGRIVEEIFERMIREDPQHTFTVIPFGYEKTTPELAQYGELIKNYETLKVIRQSPDFILIKNDKTEVHFVEVKYRREFNERVSGDIKESAEALLKHWSGAWFFLATQKEFYFDKCTEIIKNGGKMNRLDNRIITPEIQNKYLSVLKEFVRI
ncbi:MAG: hypothetical protein UV35_C0041G0005 [candidate division WWE3 bacterium GW2011_GWB1_42_6]|uniref:Uncharacterized protein n=1 Tax=candidate division WWE3 bacterium GW2011_GWB1_42_6 TaxID=1619115 RepID=A0A0G1D3F4_UNCKA|nr:MAG: hypothetical protein UV35_C0041G0005 [candidate division WWE3 bacterium GW2011_GWB1_42_6]